jgi:hypothetical protein
MSLIVRLEALQVLLVVWAMKEQRLLPLWQEHLPLHPSEQHLQYLILATARHK